MTRSPGSRSKRFARFLLTLALSGLILLELTYLGRGAVEGWICRQIESALSEATGTVVEVRGISGNWLNHVVVEDLNLSGSEDALLQDIEGLRAEVWFSPLALLAGDLGGLRSCRVTARGAVIRTDGVLPDPGTGTPGEAAPPGRLIGLFPEGASFEIGELSYGNRDARRVGPLHLRLLPGTARRAVQLDHHGLRAWLSVHPDDKDGIGVAVGLAADDPGQILRSLGVENESQGGELRLAGHCLLQPLSVSGSLELSNVRYDQREIGASRLSWLLDSESLRVHEGTLQLAGVSLHTDGLLAPSPLASTGMPLEMVRGNLNVEISDLAPYVELLPDLAQWLPVQGRMRTWMDAGRMHIAEAWLNADDARLQVGPGDIDLAGSGSGQLSFDLSMSSPRSVDLPDVGELRTSGTIRGTLAGNLTDPRLNGRVELGPTSLAGFRAERLLADVGFAQERIRFTDLDALELGPESATAISHMTGEVDIDLAEPYGTAVQAAVEGQAHEGWLEILEIPDPPEVAVPDFALSGRASFGDDLPRGTVELSLSGLALPPHPPADLSTSLTLAEDGVLEVERLTVRGFAQLDLEGSAPLRGGPIRLTATAPEQDLELPTAFLPGGPLPGSFSLQLDAEGEPGALVFHLDLEADLSDAAERVAAFWPREGLGPPPEGSGRVQLHLGQTSAGTELERLAVELGSTAVTGSGPIPLRWQPDSGFILEPSDQPLELAVSVQATGPEGLELPVSFVALMRIGSSDISLDDIELDAGPGRLSGAVSLSSGWADWLEPRGGSPALAGALELREISLEVLPAAALGLGVLEGTLTGRASLAGTLEEPEPHVELDLADSTVKVGTMPRLEHLGAHFSVRPDRIRIDNLSGTLGGGELSADLTVHSGDGYLWGPAANTTITGNLTGRDVLIVDGQNLRLRGQVEVALTGSADDVLLGGTVRITNGRYARRLNLLPDLSVRGGAANGVSGAVSLLPIDSALGPRIRVDLAIDTVRDFQVRTHLLDTDLTCSLRLLGQASLAHLEGTVASSAGVLRLPGSSLRLDSLLASFPPDNPLQPEVVAHASGRRHGVQIQLDVHGPLASPEIQISSIPSFSPQELWTLVTTGALPETLRAQGLQGHAALVGTYLAEELAAWYTGGESMEDTAGFFDRFNFVLGGDISDDGQESLVVEFALSDNLFLQGARDVYEDYNGGIVLRFRF